MKIWYFPSEEGFLCCLTCPSIGRPTCLCVFTLRATLLVGARDGKWVRLADGRREFPPAKVWTLRCLYLCTRARSFRGMVQESVCTVREFE